jgi:hypothetical protein
MIEASSLSQPCSEFLMIFAMVLIGSYRTENCHATWSGLSLFKATGDCLGKKATKILIWHLSRN